jgi:hypothetical protein
MLMFQRLTSHDTTTCLGLLDREMDRCAFLIRVEAHCGKVVALVGSTFMFALPKENVKDLVVTLETSELT